VVYDIDRKSLPRSHGSDLGVWRSLRSFGRINATDLQSKCANAAEMEISQHLAEINRNAMLVGHFGLGNSHIVALGR
jgi:hypothetical protein